MLGIRKALLTCRYGGWICRGDLAFQSRWRQHSGDSKTPAGFFHLRLPRRDGFYNLWFLRRRKMSITDTWPQRAHRMNHAGVSHNGAHPMEVLPQKRAVARLNRRNLHTVTVYSSRLRRLSKCSSMSSYHRFEWELTNSTALQRPKACPWCLFVWSPKSIGLVRCPTYLAKGTLEMAHPPLLNV